MTDSNCVAMVLTDNERRFLLIALNEYFGPAKGAPVLAQVVGVDSVPSFHQLVDRLLHSIENGQPLTDLDWARALVLSEISWASDLLGAGSEFATSMRDEVAAPLLRSLQSKIATSERIRLLLECSTEARPT